MQIPRIHLFELEDQGWFPVVLRDLATDYLHFMETKFALHRPVVALVAEVLQKSGTTQIVDLCSGGGGPIPSRLPELATQGLTPHVTLTDRFPNIQAFHRVAAESGGRISFRGHPQDARAVPADLRGMRTLFNCERILRKSYCVWLRLRESMGITGAPDRRRCRACRAA